SGTDVLEIIGDLRANTFEIRIVALFDLSEPRQPRQHLLPGSVPVELTAQLLEDPRLLRPWPHHVHVPLEHVHQLWELIEPRIAQETPEPRHPGVIGLRPYLHPLRRLPRHRPELVDREQLPSEVHPPPRISDIPAP